MPNFLTESWEEILWVGIPSFHTNASPLGLYNSNQTPCIFQSARCKNKMKNIQRDLASITSKIYSNSRTDFRRMGTKLWKKNKSMLLLMDCLHKLVKNILWLIISVEYTSTPLEPPIWFKLFRLTAQQYDQISTDLENHLIINSWCQFGSRFSSWKTWGRSEFKSENFWTLYTWIQTQIRILPGT